MPADALARLLSELRDHQSVPASRISERMRRQLDPLFEYEVLRERRSAAGFRVDVQDSQALKRFINSEYPNGLEGTPADDLPPKAAAIARRGDSKAAARHASCPVLLRGFDSAELNDGTNRFPVARLTEQFDLAALRVGAETEWQLDLGRVVLVENFESFLHAEAVIEGVDLVLYTSGVLPQLVLDWLDGWPTESVAFVHFSDYDPTGLDEYRRLRNRLGGRVELHVPDNLEELLESYGKEQLLEDSSDLFERLRRSDLDDVRKVTRLLLEYGCGLEQEALLIP